MLLKGNTTINAPKENVWAFLTNAESVSQCAPGIESFEVIAPNLSFRMLACIGFGTVKVTFNTEVTWLALEPPHQAKMKAHGTAPGSSADAITEMVLIEMPDGSTQLEWSADVAIHGSIASLATRLMGSVAQKMSGAFFECVKGKIDLLLPR